MTIIEKIKAEIKGRINSYSIVNDKELWIVQTYMSVLSFVDTLESEKPMQEGLEEEIEKRYDQAKWGYVDGVGAVVMDKGQFIRIARYFAQWGAEHLKK